MSGDVTEDFWRGLTANTPARIALGRVGSGLPTQRVLQFSLAHAQARDAVHTALDGDGVEASIRALGFETLRVASAAPDRQSYLCRPDWGRKLSEESRKSVEAAIPASPVDLALVVADGLSSTAVHVQAARFLAALQPHLAREGWTTGPVVIAEQARVALGDEVGELFKARAVLLMVGERPGLSSPDSLGLYITYGPRIGRNDGERNCISNVRDGGLSHDLAAFKAAWLLREALRRGLTGVKLKDESDLLPAGSSATPQIGT